MMLPSTVIRMPRCGQSPRSLTCRTVADFTETANGMAALKYTGRGLYQDLSTLPDKFGEKVRYETDSLKKFGVVQDMYEDYNNQLSRVNQSFARLEDQFHNTAHQIDAAESLVETEKLTAKLQAVQGTLDVNLQYLKGKETGGPCTLTASHHPIGVYTGPPIKCIYPFGPTQ
jgi:hypothetical protein